MRSFHLSHGDRYASSVPCPKFLAVLTAVWLFWVCSPVGAQIDWENTTSQNAWHHEVANWAGDLVPSSTDVARFNEAGEYEVWWNATTASSAQNAGQLRVEDGRVTLLNKENLGDQYQFNIKGTAADNDILISGPITHATVRGLHLHNEGDTQILSGGTLTLDGSHAQGAQFTHLSTDKGFNLAGNLNVLSGAKVNGTGASIGHLTGSTGVATVSGSGSQWHLSGGRSFLDHKNGLLVGDAGHGTLNIEAGAVVTHELASYALDNQWNKVGAQAGGEGFVTITGKDSHWDMGKNANGGFLFVGDFGRGTVTVESGGRLTSWAGLIGTQNSMGLVTIAGEGSQWSVGSSRWGVRVGPAGTLNIEDGGMVDAGTVGVVGNLTVHGANSKLETGSLTVAGNLHIENGGVVESYFDMGASRFYIGGVSGVKGVVTISGSGSQLNLINENPFGGNEFASMTVGENPFGGNQGDGELTIQDGGVLNHTTKGSALGSFVFVGRHSGSRGLVTVTGPGSQWNLSEQGKSNTFTELFIGYQGGYGTLLVAAGGVVSNGGSLIGVGNSESASGTPQSVGVATITGQGSHWNSERELIVGQYSGGFGTLNITEGGLVTTVKSKVGYLKGAEGVVTITGKGSHWDISSELLVGGGGHGTLKVQDGGLVSVHGTTEIGTGSLVHVDGGRFEFGKTSWDEFSSIQADHGSMAGVVTHHGNNAIDSLHAFRNSGVELFDVQVENHGTLHGQGAVDVGVLNHGTIDVKAGEQLQFSGRGSMNLSEIKNAGGEIRFQHDLVNRHGGLIEGHGQFRAGDGWTNEGLIQLTGDAEIHGDLKNSFSGTDTTEIGIHISNGHTVTFHDDVTMVAGNRNVAVGEAGYAVFRGSYNGGTEGPGAVQMLGDLRPGNSAGAVRFEGDLQMGQSSTTSLELGGLFDGGGDRSLTEFDWIDAMGNVELAGALNVELIDGFELHRGNVFEVFRISGTLSGQYDGLAEGALVGRFGSQDLFITYGSGDGNDIALFTGTVPEPTTMLIWSLLAGLGMTTRRRGRR